MCPSQVAGYERWPKTIRPIVHFSSSRKIFEDPASGETAHADFIYQRINSYGLDVDIMLEAKAKEQATLRFIREFA